MLRMDEHGPGGPVSKIRKRIWGGSLHVNWNSMQYITSDKVCEVYFTGMFTSNQGDLSVHYYDPESGRVRQYYPDFLAKMADGSYQLIEVKGDNKIDDEVVKAKVEAAEEMAVASGVKYLMYAGSTIVKTHILDEDLQSNFLLSND